MPLVFKDSRIFKNLKDPGLDTFSKGVFCHFKSYISIVDQLWLQRNLHRGCNQFTGNRKNTCRFTPLATYCLALKHLYIIFLNVV